MDNLPKYFLFICFIAALLVLGSYLLRVPMEPSQFMVFLRGVGASIMAFATAMCFGMFMYWAEEIFAPKEEEEPVRRRRPNA